MDVFCQDGGAQPPAGLLFDYPPAWNRALCRFIDAERRRFRGRSIRMELDLNGCLQAAVTYGFPTKGLHGSGCHKGSSLLRWN